MDIAIEMVTPKKAAAWLNQNQSNRKMREGVAEKYADDMRNGRWTKCPVPISFYEDGEVADGQHRLWAIVESGTTQRFPIARGLSREDGLNIDTGTGRSLVDNARISGVDPDLSNELIGLCRAIEYGMRAGSGAMSTRSLSNSERLELVARHRDAGKWTITNGPRGKLMRNSIILAAVARAWYAEKDHDRLRRFGDVLSTGFYNGNDETAAIALRSYLTAKGTVASSQALWRDTFLKTQNAISYFMRSKKLTVIKAVGEEAYPLKPARANGRAKAAA